MKLEDASFEEAPTTNMRMMELTKSEQLEVLSMLWMTATDDHLQQGAVIKVTERFNISHSTVYQLWECTASTCAMGIINSPELMSWGEIPGECLSI